MATEYLNNKFLEKTIKEYRFYRQEKEKYIFIIKDLKESFEIREKNKKKQVHSLKDYEEKYNNVLENYENYKLDLANSFKKLSENLVAYAKEIIIDEDDAIQEGIMICFEKMDKFNPEFGKAFNYMTTCIINHYRYMYRSDKNYKDLKQKFKSYLENKNSNSFIKNGKEIHKSDCYLI
jgi:hypothetical protein